MFNTNCFIIICIRCCKTDSTQRAQTIEMDRTIRKMNSSFMWISLTTCFCQVSVDFIYLCLFRIVISYVAHYKRHSVLKRSHLLGHEYTRNQGCREMFHMREESLLIVLKVLKIIVFVNGLACLLFRSGNWYN